MDSKVLFESDDVLGDAIFLLKRGAQPSKGKKG